MYNKLNADYDYLSIWNQLENGHWVLVRSYTAHYAKRIVKEINEYRKQERRYYACFPAGFNPNKDIEVNINGRQKTKGN